MQPSLADQTRRMPKLIESLLGARACHFCLFRTLVHVSIAMTCRFGRIKYTANVLKFRTLVA